MCVGSGPGKDQTSREGNRGQKKKKKKKKKTETMTLGRESGKAQGKVAALSPSSPSRRLERKAQRPW